MKKVKLIVLVMVVAFILMGAGYAAWTDVTEINGTITTGWLDVKFANPSSTDSLGYIDPEMSYDVGCTKASLSGDDGKTLQVEIDNGYPGYNSEVKFDIENKSSIPVKVKDIVITKNFGDELEISFAEIEELKGKEIAVGASLKDIHIVNLITEEAQQNSNYSYSVTITFQQWNID